MKDFSFETVDQLLEKAFDLDYFHTFEEDGFTEPAIPHLWVPGNCPLVVIVGENASGKSFMRRIVQGMCQRSEMECMTISMEGRRGGFAPPIVTALIYGDEMYNSTGQLSGNTVTAGINTCKSRDKDHVIFWDEPDFGLSGGWSAGVGIAIRDFVTEIPKHTKAAFVVSHSKDLVKELLPLRPHYVHLGSTEHPDTLQAWLDAPSIPRAIGDLDAVSHARFKRIQTVLDALKKPLAKATTAK